MRRIRCELEMFKKTQIVKLWILRLGQVQWSIREKLTAISKIMSLMKSSFYPKYIIDSCLGLGQSAHYDYNILKIKFSLMKLNSFYCNKNENLLYQICNKWTTFCC